MNKCPECGGKMPCNCGYAVNKSECPECGGKMDDDGECEDCGYETTRNTVPAPEGGGMVLGQPRAHAATTQAAAASMDHPPARGAAIKAFDHSKSGKSIYAAKQHGNAADAHDDAAKDAYSNGDNSNGDQHANAAMLHRKAAAMHSIDPTNMVGNANPEGHNQYTKGGGGGRKGGKGMMRELEGAEEDSRKANMDSNIAKTASKFGHESAKEAHGEAAMSHWAAAAAHKGEGNEDKADEHIAAAQDHYKKFKSGTNNMRRSIAKMSRSQVVNALRRHLCPKEQKVMNDLNTETLKQVLNAKVQGSNADGIGDGDFDAGRNAGGWDDSLEGASGYKNRDIIGDDTEDEAEEGAMKTGGEDANDEIRGRRGVENSESRWLAMAPPEFCEQYLQGKRQIHNQKVSIIRQLVGHLPRKRQDALVANQRLLQKTIPQLEEMLLLQGPLVNTFDELRAPMYLGSGDVPIVNQEATGNSASDANDIACLVPQTLNFKAIAEEEAQVRNGRSHGVNYANGERSSVATSAEAAM